LLLYTALCFVFARLFKKKSQGGGVVRNIPLPSLGRFVDFAFLNTNKAMVRMDDSSLVVWFHVLFFLILQLCQE
jgi:hypothetical protein